MTSNTKLADQGPDRIYLQPKCCSEHAYDGRQWCEDDFVWECECDEDYRKPVVPYIRADLARPSPMPGEVARELDEAIDDCIADANYSFSSRLKQTLTHRLTALTAANDHARLRDAAQALIDDVRRRYPGEELRCEFMRALDDALATPTPQAGDALTASRNDVLREEHRAVLQQMLDARRKQLASCERMIELLQPEWDKFEARTGHDVYVAREYADHTSAARTHRKEIAALEAALSTTPTMSAEDMREAAAEALDGLAAREAARGDRGVLEWIDAWEMGADAIRSLPLTKEPSQ